MQYALIIGIVFLLAALLYALALRKRKDAPGQPGDILGAEGIITTPLDGEARTGSIRIDGMEWKALPAPGKPVPEPGTVARVTGIDGNRLLVEPAEEDMV
ncbi:MAG: NfeD family protein [Lachnospiraceae bacterium]|nr:NfeD family protein [Lachnospiraceae bacterium]